MRIYIINSFSVADPCIYFPLKESACPRRVSDIDCSHDLQSDKLCDGDNDDDDGNTAMPYKNINNDINNCGWGDVFKCKRGIENHIYSNFIHCHKKILFQHSLHSNFNYSRKECYNLG